MSNLDLSFLGDDVREVFQLYADAAVRRTNLLINPDYSDFKICCGGQEIKIHRGIMAGRSEYFDRQFRDGFTVGHQPTIVKATLIDDQEATDKTINLDEDDADVVALVVWFMYTDRYPRTGGHSDIAWNDNDKTALLKFAPYSSDILDNKYALHIMMARAGDRFLMPNLVNTASIALEQTLTDVSLKELSEDENFHKAVAILYKDEVSLPRLREWLPWFAARLSTTAQEEEALAEVARKVPVFLPLVLAQRNGGERRNIYCCRCHRGLDAFENQWVLTLRKVFPTGCEDEAIESVDWFVCTCRYKGFCSDQCRIDDVNTIKSDIFCDQCEHQVEFATVHLQHVNQNALECLSDGVDCERSGTEFKRV